MNIINFSLRKIYNSTDLYRDFNIEDVHRALPQGRNVTVLSFSDYFYAEGMVTCDISNWIRVNNNAISYFGGITQ